jgi:hypothetical protein
MQARIVVLAHAFRIGDSAQRRLGSGDLAVDLECGGAGHLAHAAQARFAFPVKQHGQADP